MIFFGKALSCCWFGLLSPYLANNASSLPASHLDSIMCVKHCNRVKGHRAFPLRSKVRTT